MIKLIARKERFALEYLANGMNGRAAAIAAGYSEKTAHAQAYDLLHDDKKVMAFIAEHSKQITDKIDISIERVLQTAGALAFFDIRKLYDTDGNLLPPGKWPDDVALAIEGLEVNTNLDGSKTKKVKLAGRRGAIDLLGKYHKLWSENTITINKPLADYTDDELLALAKEREVQKK